ncbi:MAG: hypothetical protein CL670_15985 [Balneola sp.]|jgi:hypothetical protein|nr:hypothetical protein [Balneola sp.]MBE80609.1 hypothetical protein [Balneola sp.]MBE80661.1 hypothetical protein [Balneola sp.]HBX67796.1 hypothetical protein [Balneolaceae bacterium]|tara:strand:- start:1252 stop:1929 length:678 start_codon:yes stop_codon:yes gene_type:complete
MENFKRGRFEWQMLELPDGITTSNGNWYHITREGIEEYVPGLLKEKPLELIIEEADAWMKSSDGLALMLFFVLVYMSVNPLIASVVSLIFYFIWYFNASVFVNVAATPMAKLISKDGFIYTVSAVLLIGITLNDMIAGMGIIVDFSAVWYGLALFFLFKVGLLGLTLQFAKSKFLKKPTIPKQDRILNMLLIRYGMKHGILTGKIEEMEKELIRIANYHKKKKKK